MFNLINEDKERPIIKVIGVGGGGSNAVNYMFKHGIVGVDFAICNTDAQAMELSPVPTKIQLGPSLTQGRGAGSKPDVGRLACEESIEEVRQYLSNNCRMLFVTAGMGGGTGTGAAPIIAQTAREMDILTVGIVTLPFSFEGGRRGHQAYVGLEALKKQVDTLIVISNDKLRLIYGELPLSEAFSKADSILTTATKGIAEIITVPGYVNVDFEDVNTVMRDSGVAIMGIGTAEGENRARRAVDEALNSPLLEDNNIWGAKHILLNITSGTREVTMEEIFQITEFVQEEAGYGTDLIWGNCTDESLGESLSVAVIATGFEPQHKQISGAESQNRKVVIDLDDESESDTFQNPDEKEQNAKGQNEQMADNVIEFTDLQKPARKFSYEQPYRSEPFAEEPKEEAPQLSPEELEALRRKKLKEEQERKEYLRSLHRKLKSPQAVVELENEPAYLRRGVKFDELPDARQPGISNWSIGEEEEANLRNDGGNSYLHGQPD